MQRVQKARQEAIDGVFALEKPVGALFSGFDHVCRVVTMQHYRTDLGLRIAQPALKPATEFFQSAATVAPPR